MSSDPDVVRDVLMSAGTVASPGWSPPNEFEEYRIVRAIGAGTMGQVFLAHDQLLDRAVAIKFLKQVEPAARERFFIEARAVARLSHPNVLAIHRVGEIHRRPYLVSEFVRGPSLASLPKPLPWERALRIGIGLARGLGAAHRRGVLHRDIKPANVMIDDDDEPKLLDFGLAKLADGPQIAAPREGRAVTIAAPREGRAVTIAAPREGHAVMINVAAGTRRDRPVDATISIAGRIADAPANGVLTHHDALVGTPLYLAPEIWAGAWATRASDVYALGIVLYELLVGHAPHAGLSLDELAHAKDIPPVAGRDIPPRFAAVVDACLAREPSKRPDSGDALGELLEAVVPARIEELAGSPYRGLSTFEPEHRSLFFGRAEEARAVIERLRTETLVIVAGDSGAGKSSLCLAAVLPVIAEKSLGGKRWQAVTVKPGPRPRLALDSALAARTEVDGLLLFVDQLEELLTVADPTEAAWFAEQLAELAVARSDTRVLASARTDFLGRIAELPGIGELVGRALFLLGPLSDRGLRDAIIGPARALGYEFESSETVDELVASGRRHLPLLQFTLAELWEARDDRTRRVPADSLAQIGGVSGALARRADQVMAALGEAEREIAWRILLRLTTAEGTRAVMTRAELREAVDDEAADRVVERLVNARLLTANADRVEVVHEALLSGWPRLVEWRRTHEEGAHLRDQISEAARRWHARGRPRGLLWRGDALVEYRRWRKRWPERLTDVEADFGAACEADARRSRRTLIAAVATMFALLAVGLVVLYQSRATAERRRREAERERRTLYVQQGLTELERKRYARAMPFFLEAVREGDDSAPVRFAMGQVTRALARMIASSSDELGITAWLPDGKRFIAGGRGKKLVLFDQDGHELRRFPTEVDNPQIQIDDRGRLLVYGGELAELWDLDGTRTHRLVLDKAVFHATLSGDSLIVSSPTTTSVMSLTGTSTPVFDARAGARICSHAISQDRARIAIATLDEVVLVDPATRAMQRIPLPGERGTCRLRFSRDLLIHVAEKVVLIDPVAARIVTTLEIPAAADYAGPSSALGPDERMLAIAGPDGVVRVWDLEHGRMALQLAGHVGRARTVAFSHDGKRLVTSGIDATVRTWNLATGRQELSYDWNTALSTRATGMSTAELSGDGTRVVATGDQLQIWDARVELAVRDITIAGGAPSGARMSPDEHRIATAGLNGAVVILDRDGHELSRRDVGAALWDLGWSADGSRIAVSGRDGYAAILSATDLSTIHTLPHAPGASVNRITYSPDGTLVMTAVGDRTAHLWDAATGAPRGTITETGPVMSAVWSPDMKTIATASWANAVHLWDARTLAQIAEFRIEPLRFLDVTFSADGKRVLGTSSSGSVRLWDIATRRELMTFAGHTGPVSTAVISPDGQLLATSSADGSVRVWDIASGRSLDVQSQGGEALQVTWIANGTKLLVATPQPGLSIWDVAPERRSLAELEAFAKEHVPYRLVQGRLEALR